jgi:hypothetical protein
LPAEFGAEKYRHGSFAKLGKFKTFDDAWKAVRRAQ